MPDETIAVNRRAHHEYAIEDTFEAGIVLTGTEIKSIRAHRANLAEAYARIEGGEAWLIGAHIAPYAEGNRWNHEPTRTRKLLLHRGQIAELTGLTQQKGLRSFGYNQGRYWIDRERSNESEHLVHHFHKLVHQALHARG